MVSGLERFFLTPDIVRDQESATLRDFIVRFFRSLAGLAPSQTQAINTSERQQKIMAAHAEMSRMIKSVYNSTSRLLAHYKIGQRNQKEPLKDQALVADQQIDLAINTDEAMGIIWIVFTESQLLPDEGNTDDFNSQKAIKHTTCRLELHKFRGPQATVVFQIFSLEVNDKLAHLTTQPGVIINSELKVAERMYKAFEAELLNRTITSNVMH
jgi:hypothetical protein